MVCTWLLVLLFSGASVVGAGEQSLSVGGGGAGGGLLSVETWIELARATIGGELTLSSSWILLSKCYRDRSLFLK